MSSSNRFANIGYEDFRKLATDESLSQYERIGFPDSYRKDHEQAIVADIRAKLTNLEEERCNVIDIGPGCTDVPKMIIDLCARQGHSLTLIDSPEMLALLPEAPFVTKVPGLYPGCVEQQVDSMRGTVDALLSYSVIQYAFTGGGFFQFVDMSLSLLAAGGQWLIGDIPNVSKRKRFFASESGIAFHRAFMQVEQPPVVEFNRVEHDLIDDAVVFAILQRARSAGFDAYVLPQHPSLPLANRREDILITRP